MSIPHDHIQRLASYCDDPQMPSAVRLSAKIVQSWLNNPDSEDDEDGLEDNDV